MSFFCTECEAEMSAPNAWEGLSVACPRCAQVVLLQYRSGQSIPASGYAITFRDFCGLIDYDGWRQKAHPVLAELLDCTIDLAIDGRFLLRDSHGALIPREV